MSDNVTLTLTRAELEWLQSKLDVWALEEGKGTDCGLHERSVREKVRAPTFAPKEKDTP